jgi:hypothetical protein
MSGNPYKNAVVSLLRMDGADLPETAKYVLARLLLAYGNMSSLYRASELATLMGLSQTSVVGALRELCRVRPGSPLRCGYLIREPVYAGNALSRVGRPRTAYRVAEDFLAWLLVGKQGIGSELQQEIVAALLLAGGKSKWGKFERRDGEGMAALADTLERVPRRLRYLLAVLWSLADETGVVWGMTPEGIAQLAGTRKAKAAPALQALQEQGFILRRVSAHEGGALFKPFSGAFFLNPSHPLIRGAVTGLWAQRQSVKGGDEIARILDGSVFHEAHDIEDMQKAIQAGRWQLLEKYAGSLDLAEDELGFKKRNLFLPALVALECMQGEAIGSVQFSALNAHGRDAALRVLLRADVLERRFFADVVFYFASRLLTRNVMAVAGIRPFRDEDIFAGIEGMVSDSIGESCLSVRKLITLWLYGEVLAQARALFELRLSILHFQKSVGLQLQAGQEKKSAVSGQEFYSCFPVGVGLIEMLYWLPSGETGKWSQSTG